MFGKMAVRSFASVSTMMGYKHLISVQLVARVASRSQSTIPLVTADEWWGKCKKVDVLGGDKMSYYDSEPKHSNSKHAVIFLHGNPTSSYLWRNVIPRVEPIARCLAPDLIGMGRSDKLANNSYRFVDHYRYLSAWLDSVNLPEKVSIVCHDWGSALGFHWSNEHRDRLEGLVHMESIIKPFPGWHFLPEGDAKKTMQGIRSEAGEEMVLNQNVFVEQLLPFASGRPELLPEEMDAYREPYQKPGEDRRPTLTWPRQIPIMGHGPDDVIAIAVAYHAWLKESANLPKLYIHATPGIFSEWIKQTTEEEDWPNHKIVRAEGSHFLQETSPFTIGDSVREFLSHVYK